MDITEEAIQQISKAERKAESFAAFHGVGGEWQKFFHESLLFQRHKA